MYLSSAVLWLHLTRETAGREGEMAC